MSLHSHGPQIPVENSRDYTLEFIEDMRVDECFAEADAYDEGLVTVSLCGTPEDPASHVDGGQTFGYEFDMTPDNAERLAQSLLDAARKSREQAALVAAGGVE